jgi:hypothetical protein
MALYGWTWVQDVEPTTGVLATQEWRLPTSGEIYVRDVSNTSWIYFGNVNNRMGGAAEVAGAVMTGPLLDTPNLPPLQDPDFLGTVRQGGFNVALQRNLADLEKRLTDRITYQVREQFLSQFQQSGTASNIAAYSKLNSVTEASLSVGAGFTGLAIDLPTFLSDGLTARPSQLLFYGWAVEGQRFGGTGWADFTEVDPTAAHSGSYTPLSGSRVLGWNQAGLGGSAHQVLIHTWAFAVR